MGIERIVSPTASRVIEEQGEMTPEFRFWTQIMTSQSIITGDGPPENVVEATVNSLYKDNNGTAGNILHIKNANSVAGNKKQGWILI